MNLFRKSNEISFLDERLRKSTEEVNDLIEENRELRNQLIDERNALFLERRQLELDKKLFEKEKAAIHQSACMQTEHLTAELEFIKKHRMLPAECKFYKEMPKVPSVMKKLR